MLPPLSRLRDRDNVLAEPSGISTGYGGTSPPAPPGANAQLAPILPHAPIVVRLLQLQFPLTQFCKCNVPYQMMYVLTPG